VFVFKTSNGDPTLPILSNLETDFFKFLHFNTFASFLFSYTIHNTQYTIHNTQYLLLSTYNWKPGKKIYTAYG